MRDAELIDMAVEGVGDAADVPWNSMSDPGAFAVGGPEEQAGGDPLPLTGAGVVVCLMGVRAVSEFGSRSAAEPNGRQCRGSPGPRRQLKSAKDKSTERIDGIVATIMAIGRAMVVQEKPQPEYRIYIA